MIKQDEFQRVCRSAGLVAVSNSKTTAYKTFDQKEGIEIVMGKIQTFSILTMSNGSKEKAISEKAESNQINLVLGAFEKEISGVQDESKKNETKGTNTGTEANTKEVQKTPSSGLNDIPAILEEKRIITPQDLDAWKKLSTFDRILLFQKTPKSLIKKRRGCLLPEFQGRQKGTLTDENYRMFSYLDGNTMKLSANIAFLFEWSAVVESEKYFESQNEVCVRGYVQVEINGKLYRRACGGSGIKKGSMDWGDTMEAAITEMTKRGLYHFLHGDVKRGEADDSM